MKYGYVAVEGPHDLAFTGRLLKLHGLDRVKMLADLDPFWHVLVPRTYPYRDDLLKRVPVPTFFAGETHSIAVHVVDGDSGFGNTLRDSLDTLYQGLGHELTGVGVLLDADRKVSAAERFEKLKSTLNVTPFPRPIRFPDTPGEVSASPPRAGIFVLPDNDRPGTLEDLLLECARKVYPTLEAGAQTYLAAASAAPELDREDRRELGKSAGRNKVLAACIASVLRPGKAIQVSIQDNRWLDAPLARFPEVTVVHDFLAKLLELPPP
jgi:hypothetical protein